MAPAGVAAARLRAATGRMFDLAATEAAQLEGKEGAAVLTAGAALEPGEQVSIRLSLASFLSFKEMFVL